MVEAIAYGTTVIATESGAAGLDTDSCGPKLVIVQNNDWSQFAKAITEQVSVSAITPPQYYSHYYWGTVIKTLLQALNKPA